VAERAGGAPGPLAEIPESRRLDDAPLCERLRRFAGWLEDGARSPLYVALLRGAADDCERGGVVARVFAGIEAPPGSIPALRLMAALHYLVLRGQAPALARYFPSTGGGEAPDGAWRSAQATLAERFEEVRARLRRGVQTNEPGRSAALYGGLLWASERLCAPLRVLEIGASAGLNLLADRFAYVVGGELLGDPSSPLRFEEPWRGAPVADPAAAARRLRVTGRRGCDPAPIDVRAPGARELLMSYVWPDELERLARLQRALALAITAGPAIECAEASGWLRALLAEEDAPGTVVTQSVMWQYLSEGERAAITSAIEAAAARAPLVWLALEPGGDATRRFELVARAYPEGERVLLAHCNDHGPPVEWQGR
jgi:hypothetical protein